MENWWNTHNRKRNGLNTKCAVRPAFFIFFLPKCYIYFHGTHQWSCCLMPWAAWHCGSEPGGWSTGEQCAVCPQNSAQVQVRVCSLLVVLTLGNYLPCEPQFSYLESGARNDSSGSKGLWGSDDWCMKPRRECRVPVFRRWTFSPLLILSGNPHRISAEQRVCFFSVVLCLAYWPKHVQMRIMWKDTC